MATGKSIDCVILGLLSHESLTGYEIKKRMHTVLPFFWSASFGSIYPALRQLVGAGRALPSGEKSLGRGRIRYAITEQGLRHLQEWLRTEAAHDEFHSETLLKIFFSEQTGPQTALMHIENFRRRLGSQLPYLSRTVQSLASLAEERPEHQYYLLTARFGEQIYRAALDWCEQAEQLLDQ